jgi:hypothetical protein
MTLETFLQKIDSQPQEVNFKETIAVIEAYYQYTPTAFRNGKHENAAGENEGSCKIMAFAQLHKLTPEQTLHCFGDYYRKEVLQAPDGESHQNIRQFMQHGWEGVQFSSPPLNKKTD